jgi:peptide/nickel transport system permease protein
LLKYIIKRIIWLIPVLLGVTVIVFTLLYFAPGDPALMALGDTATEEALENYREELGINGSYLERLGRYVVGLVQGDLGISYKTKTPVVSELAPRLAKTMNISLWSIIFSIVVGILLGIISAIKQYSVFDAIATGISLFGISMPMFWQGLMLIIICSVWLNWLPPSGYGSFKQMIMPVLALGVNGFATIMRTTRSSMLDVMNQDYIRTAKAKGQTYWNVILKHGLRNALIPIITVIGMQISVLLAGSTIAESIFSIAGVGKYMIDSINFRDYNAVQGAVLMVSFIAALINLFVDIAYTFADPRIKNTFVSKKKKKS